MKKKLLNLKRQNLNVSARRVAMILCLGVAALMVSSCATKHARFFRGDVIGFSDEVQTSYETETRGLLMNLKPQSAPYNLLDDEGKKLMYKEISNVKRGENTAAYYAMELAAERVKYVRKKIAKRDPKTRYYIFLLTDGLDNASTETAKHDKRMLFTRTPEQYQKRLQKKLKSAMGWFGKNQFEVYPLFYEGDDIQETKQRNKMTDAQYEERLQEDMKCFRYSSEGMENAPALIHGSDFKAIFQSLSEKIDISSYSFKVPKSYANKEIRMTFKDGTGKEVEMTAKLVKSLSSFSLKDVKMSNGAKYNEIRSLPSTVFYSDDYMNAYFCIDDFRVGDKAYYPVGKEVTQEVKSSGYWQLNSEYEELTETAINTYFILVIDGSRSLDGKNRTSKGFEEETNMAKEIMKKIAPRNGSWE